MKFTSTGVGVLTPLQLRTNQLHDWTGGNGILCKIGADTSLSRSPVLLDTMVRRSAYLSDICNGAV